MDELTLKEKQQLFMRLLAVLIMWVYSHPNWELTLGEGHVGDTDAADGDWDGPHRKGGLHYQRLAIDLNLFIEDQYIANYHQAWDDIGQFWKRLHNLCRWGGDFSHRDYNHFSIEHDGRA